MNKTKFAIGCLVQWYECDIIHEYINTLKTAIDVYDGEVIVDINIISDQTLEKCISAEQHSKCIEKITKIIGTPVLKNWNVNVIGYLHTIADYRREFNDLYCNDVDVLIWGESDMLVPKQMFSVLDMLHCNVNVTKYIATFGICKMWDSSWKPLEHPDFTDKPFIEGDFKNWWSIPYTMSVDEMNSFNDKIENLDVTQITPHKFNGCGLVISSEVIRAGVNIPKSIFFIHEDTALMLMIRKVLGDIPQYHIRNILIVHNRKHPNKRMYIHNEQSYSDTEIDAKRKSHDWYVTANKMCSENCYNLFNINYKSYNWHNVWS